MLNGYFIKKGICIENIFHRVYTILDLPFFLYRSYSEMYTVQHGKRIHDVRKNLLFSLSPEKRIFLNEEKY